MMFGSIRTFDDELKIREHKLYKRYYCALCREIANYSQFSRLFLSYDMVFLAMLTQAPQPALECHCRCKAFRHCRKRSYGEELHYIAAVSELLLWHKLKNDVDDGERRKYPLLIALGRAYRRAEADYPALSAGIAKSLAALAEQEAQGCGNLCLLERNFCESFLLIFKLAVTDDGYNSLRGELVSHVAAWVYLFDIVSDVEEDRCKGTFNPILIQSGPSREEVVARMDKHLVEAVRMAECLPYSDATPIIRNILTLGLPVQTERLREKLAGKTK